MAAMTLTVSDADAGTRLDVWLVKRVEGMSRARAKKLTAEAKVLVNENPARKGRILAAGDVVELLEVPAPAMFAAPPDSSLELSIVHEDDAFVVIDKPTGAPSHPLRPDERGTAAGALVARYPEMADVGYSPREPGILHRLDTQTSGLLVAARTEDAFYTLRESLRASAWDKRYLALCQGDVSAPRHLDAPIAADPADPSRVVVCFDEREVRTLKAQPALSELVSSEPVGSMSLVEVRARSARRHQVRAHLAFLGHPLAGDGHYGGPMVPGLDRHALHASFLALPHPTTGAVLTLRSPLPEDLQAAVDTARSRGD